jgi:hypothetical protein
LRNAFRIEVGRRGELSSGKRRVLHHHNLLFTLTQASHDRLRSGRRAPPGKAR